MFPGSVETKGVEELGPAKREGMNRENVKEDGVGRAKG